MADIALADVSELRGKGIDVLAKQVIAGKSASNDPADIEESKAKADEKPKAEPKEKQPDDGVNKRIGELTRKQREAERAAAAERDARLRAEAERDELRAKAEKQPPPPRPKRPKREDFDTNDEFEEAFDSYDDALYEWRQAKGWERDAEDGSKRAKAATLAREREVNEQRNREAAEKYAKRFNEQIDVARKAHADFDEAVEASANVLLKPSLAAALVTSEVGGELQYHLAKHPEVIEKLNGMEQAAMLKELGKIELSLEPKKETADGAVDQPRDAGGKFVGKEVSAAAEPIDPVKGSAETAKGTKDPERMSVAEHREAAFRSSRGR